MSHGRASVRCQMPPATTRSRWAMVLFADARRRRQGRDPLCLTRQGRLLEHSGQVIRAQQSFSERWLSRRHVQEDMQATCLSYVSLAPSHDERQWGLRRDANLSCRFCARTKGILPLQKYVRSSNLRNSKWHATGSALSCSTNPPTKNETTAGTV